jgi:hypothetical protein
LVFLDSMAVAISPTGTVRARSAVLGPMPLTVMNLLEELFVVLAQEADESGSMLLPEPSPCM